MLGVTLAISQATDDIPLGAFLTGYCGGNWERPHFPAGGPVL